ncbi:MAG: DUF1566 domain-containing protein [Bacteroidales bacterium]|nr:DUF1566 domain-containing protein [Bacteroidales bacterium]
MKKRKFFFTFQFIQVFILLSFFNSCETDQYKQTAQIPTLISAEISDITQTSAIVGGNIVNDGGAPITARGVCWFTSDNPTIADFKTSDGIGAGIFTCYIDDLFPGKLYHARAYAINSEGVGYGPDIAFTTVSSTSLSIGDTYQGGIIFYLGGTFPEQYGLVCAHSDQGTIVPWYSQNYIYYGTTSTAIGSGQTNTSSLVSILGNGFYAAKFCDDLVLNGFDDWFLPSRDELGLMYTNLKKNGFGNFTNSSYWSSSEYDYLNAYAQYFISGRQSCNNKFHSYNIRAVRPFGIQQGTLPGKGFLTRDH